MRERMNETVRLTTSARQQPISRMFHVEHGRSCTLSLHARNRGVQHFRTQRLDPLDARQRVGAELLDLALVLRVEEGSLRAELGGERGCPSSVLESAALICIRTRWSNSRIAWSIEAALQVDQRVAPEQREDAGRRAFLQHCAKIVGTASSRRPFWRSRNRRRGGAGRAGAAGRRRTGTAAARSACASAVDLLGELIGAASPDSRCGQMRIGNDFGELLDQRFAGRVEGLADHQVNRPDRASRVGDGARG